MEKKLNAIQKKSLNLQNIGIHRNNELIVITTLKSITNFLIINRESEN